MEGWIKKDGKYQHLFRDEKYNLFVDGKLVCKKANLFIVYLFEYYLLDNKINIK